MTEQPTPRLFLSIFAYVLGKESAYPEAAVRDEIKAGELANWPAFRTLARIRATASPVQLHVSHSSLIAKARSLALCSFLDSGAPFWLSLDDDVELDVADVAKLVDAADVDVLVAPCALRGGKTPTLNVLTERPALDTPVRELASGAAVFPVELAGQACALVSRAAAEVLWREHPELRFVDHTDGRRGVGVFLEAVRAGAWWGEDFEFSRRVRASGLRLEAMCDTKLLHAGVSATVARGSLRP